MADYLRKFFLLLAVGMATLGAVGCNTMEGLGQDVEESGEAIEEEAD